MKRRQLVALTVVASSAFVWQLRSHSQTPTFDIVIRGGHVVDGTGSPWFAADIGIKGDTITAISSHLDTTGARVLDAIGLIVAPGFVDVHSHSEVHEDGQDIIGNPGAENNV